MTGLLHSPVEVAELGLVHRPVGRGAAVVTLFSSPPVLSLPSTSNPFSVTLASDAVDAREVDRNRCPFALGDDAREDRTDDDVEPVRR